LLQFELEHTGKMSVSVGVDVGVDENRN